MLSKFRLLLAVTAIASATAIGSYADGSIAEIFPNSDGVYSFTYENAEPFDDCAAIVLEGLYDAGAEFDLTEVSSSDILYYNVFSADENGDVYMNFVPTEYADATMFVGLGGETPEAVCHVMRGEAVNVVDFELVLDQKEYTVSGVGTSPVLVQYIIKAVDSYGYESVLYPSMADRTLIDYNGDKMAFVENAHAVQLENTLEAGEYSFSISYGGVTRSADFTVSHVKSKPLQKVYYVNDKKNRSNVTVECINVYPSAYFNPESVEILASVTDQYGDEMTVDWDFTVTDSDNKSSKTSNKTGKFSFVPPRTVLLDSEDKYKITIDSDEADFSKVVNVTVLGISSYTGEAASFYREYAAARDIVEMYESGELVLSSESGNDVHYTKSWTTPESYASLAEALATAEESFRLINSGELSDNQISKAKSAIQKAVKNCKIAAGQLAPIERLAFDITNISLAVGKKNTIAVKSTPSKPSEKPSYYSENPEIATVDARTGAVTAKSVGTAKIYAKNTDGSITAYYEVRVYNPITSLKFATSSMKLIAGEKIKPGVTAQPADHTDTLSYMSSNTSVAKVSSDGTITAVSKGTATITVSSESGASAKVSVSVTEPDITSVESCIAKGGSKLAIPFSITDAAGIARLEAALTFNASVVRAESVTDLEFLGGFGGMTEVSAGSVIATWNEIDLDKLDSGKFAEFNIEVLEGVEMKKYDLTFKFKGYTADGDVVNWDNGTSSGVISEKRIKIEMSVGEKDTYTVKTDAGTGGTAGGGGEFKFGEEATVRAYPSSSYDFLGWYVSGKRVSSDKTYTFTVTEAVTVQARFTLKTGGGGGGGGGGASGGGGGGGGASVSTKPQTAMVSANYSIGAVAYGTEIVLSTSTVGASIYYTLDGSIPTVASTLYTSPIKLTSESTTISAIAVKSGMNNSNLAIFTYRIENMPDTSEISIKFKENCQSIKYLPVNGYYIRPNDSATRYEVLEMVNNLFDVSGGEKVSFTDVSEDCAELVGKYASAKIVNGYPDGTFGGNREITRAELVKILSVMLAIDVDTVEAEAVTLTDIAGHWSEKYVRAFVAKGYILGYPEGDFKPDRYVTRAEAVTVINRIAGTVKTSGTAQYFIDMNAEFWGYDDIMSASDIQQ